MHRYRLTTAQFAGLARGYGDADALATVRAAQLSKRRLLLLAIAQRADRLLSAARDRLNQAFEVLERVARTAPEVVAELLSHPLLGAWATACLYRLDSPEAGATVPVEIEFGYLSGLAAAAALRAGIEFQLNIPTWNGSVLFPTLGVADLAGSGVAAVSGDATGLEIAVGRDSIRVTAPCTEDQAGWRARRSVPLAADRRLAIEDFDPYAACLHADRSARLPVAKLDRLRVALVHAWRLIERRYPRYASGIRALLVSVVPLDNPAGGGSISSSSRLACGTVSVSVPDDPAELALLLIHEVQHMKLGGLLDLVDLHTSDGAARHHAPWRADPRPVGALMQGVYAHLGVADYWRVRRHDVHGTEKARAEYEFTYWYEQTRRAAATLAGSGELTVLGEEFVAGLRTTLDEWRAEPVPAEIAGRVADLLLATSVDWRLRNYLPDPEQVGRLAQAWLAGRDREPIAAPDMRTGGMPGPAKPSPVVELTRLFVGGIDDRTTASAIRPADRAYLAGDHATAAGEYERAIAGRPDDHGAWPGLAIAMRRRDHESAVPLAERPDLVRAVYLALRASGAPAGPAELAAWLR